MLDTVHAQTAPSARWGQATALFDNTLYIQGGKVDPSNSYSYSSAPNTNDLYSLDLSTAFPISTPPWTYLSGSSNPSSSQGPSVAFHTLTPYSNNQFLTFGGDGGPALPIQTNNDSAWILNACGTCQASWTQEPTGWEGEPMRRMYHSAVTSFSEIWITGGQKADGSGLGFSDTYAFSGTSFTALPSSSTIPPDLVGHRSVFLPNGLIVVLGGYSTSWATLIPLSNIYILNTQSSPPAWSNSTVIGQVPMPRRNFALALLDDSKILIHGGGDATLQNLYPDGAILDLTVSPMGWVAAPALATGLGARVDHMAVGVGSDAFFAFGRAADGPAPPALQLYDSVQATFLGTFTPGSGDSSSGGSGGSIGSGGNSGGVTPTIVLPVTDAQTYTAGTDWPTSRVTGLIPGQSFTPTSGITLPTTSIPLQTNPNGNDNSGDSSGHQRRVAAIAVGSILGVLAGVAFGIVLVYFCLRRRSRGILGVPISRHHRLQSSGDTGGDPESATRSRGNIPVAGGPWQEGQPKRLFLGVVPIPFTRGSSSRERFDMLHDEDARSFRQHQQGKGSSINSSITGGPPVRPFFGRLGSSGRNLWDGVWNKSTTSFKAALGLGAGGFGYTNTPSAEKQSPDWWEKRKDPFADDAVAMADVPSVTAVGMGFANRKHNSQHGASDSFASSATAYRDPFKDASFGSHSRGSTSTGHIYGDLPPTEPWQPFVVPTESGPTSTGYTSPPLSPAMEELGAHLGLPLMPESGSGSGSGASEVTHFSLSSGELKSPITSHPPRSLIGSAPVTPIKRTDSWWSRFGRSSLGTRSPGAVSPIRRLSLRNSFVGGKEGYMNIEFRDPNPPPRLEGIDESGKSNDPSPNTPESQKARRATTEVEVAKKPSHSKSMSSFQTVKTADSAALERIGTRVDVLQRGRQGSSETNTPDGSMYEEGEVRQVRLVLMNHVSSPVGSEYTDRPSLVDKTSSSTNTTGHHHDPEPWSPPISSPASGTQETFQTAASHHSHTPRPPVHPHNSDESFKSALSSIPPPPKAPPKRRVTSGVAARIALFDNIAENSPSAISLPTSPTGVTGFHIPPFPPISPPAVPASSSKPPAAIPSPPKSPTPMSLAMLPRVQTGVAETIEDKRASSTITTDKRKSEVSEMKRNSGNIQYGLKERPSLFVANPDRSSGSGAEPSE
ncbi:hypothetical protein FRB97_000842 [Tulasnella sp. 331]|nr:hypothetical protein FRB97_000842 [Tulasnella sp. 331]KAG8890323.1 hypothetical protein FRB98_009391 [Tulasnella sp. 332]